MSGERGVKWVGIKRKGRVTKCGERGRVNGERGGQ